MGNRPTYSTSDFSPGPAEAQPPEAPLELIIRVLSLPECHAALTPFF